MTDRTSGVDLTITANLFPEGTVYGGGPKTFRYPDAEPLSETPVRSLAVALAELGSTGTAIRWALDRSLLHFVTGERVDGEHDDWTDEIVDRYVFEGGMTLDEWREFADTYLIELDEDGTPSRGEYAGDTAPTTLPDGTTLHTRNFEDWSDSMDWNVGGLSKVSGARTEITMWDKLPTPTPADRLEYLRGELRAERISQSELIELQNLAEHITPGDVELLEAAGVPEHDED